ncbi:MAG: DedA family protein [Fimbriimonadaceae bacterium]
MPVDASHGLNAQIEALMAAVGPWAYPVLAGLIFFQTGFVFGPVVPGNPLLISAGLFASPGTGSLSFALLWPSLALGAFSGNLLNYATGRWLGPRVVGKGIGPWRVRSDGLARAQAFLDRHGSRAIALAIFIPFVRSLAPFAAGLLGADFGRFLVGSLAGAVLWTGLFLGAGAAFGEVPFVRENLGVIVVAVVVLVGARMAWGLLARRGPRTESASQAASAESPG